MNKVILIGMAVLMTWGCQDSTTSMPDSSSAPTDPETSTAMDSPTQGNAEVTATKRPSASHEDSVGHQASPSSPAATQGEKPSPVIESMSVDTEEEQNVGLALDANDERRVIPRPLRRMNIDQLQNAISRVSNGMGWTERLNGRDVNLFQELASTLGKPDYAFATEEDLEATVLFQKFLDDAARSVCNKMLLADLDAIEAQTNGDAVDHDPLLLVHVSPEDSMDTSEDAVNANLQTLLKRFHGRVVVDSDAPMMHHWQWLYRTGTFVTQSPAEAWLGVCVGLFTHPHFYMY